MDYKTKHVSTSALARTVTRGGLIAAAAALAAAGVATGAGSADAASAPPLQITLGAQASSDTGGTLGNGVSQLNSDGSVDLQVGSTGNSAAVEVQSPAAPGNVTPPSFTTSSYGGGAPRWVVELQNGNYLFGYPSQVGGTANNTFTGDQWQGVSGNGTYDTQGFDTYQKALQDEGDINGNVPVTNAFIVDDASSSSPDVVSDIQYDGRTIAPVSYTAAYNGGKGQIENVHSGKYLNVSGGNYSPGGQVIQWDNTGKSHEEFAIVTLTGTDASVSGYKTTQGYLEAINPANGFGSFVKANGESQLTLGTAAPTPAEAQANGGALSGQLASGGTNAGADMLKSGSYYTFPNDSDYVMDDSGQSTANGAKIIAYPNNKGANQQWSLP